VRTTLTIEDGLLEEAKNRAIAEKKTLGHVVNEALRLGLLRSDHSKERGSATPLKTFRGDGLCQGVSLRDTASLLEIMEDR
jgi:hypothetical protein